MCELSYNHQPPPNLLQPLTRRKPATTPGGGPPRPSGGLRAEHSVLAARRQPQQTSQPGKVGVPSSPRDQSRMPDTKTSTQLPPTSQRMPADSVNIGVPLQQYNNYNDNITTTTVNSTTTTNGMKGNINNIKKATKNVSEQQQFQTTALQKRQGYRQHQHTPTSHQRQQHPALRKQQTLRPYSNATAANAATFTQLQQQTAPATPKPSSTGQYRRGAYFSHCFHTKNGGSVRTQSHPSFWAHGFCVSVSIGTEHFNGLEKRKTKAIPKKQPLRLK
uniref:Uncharacterized protein n=1 Tax=Glossina pallidipes TaxID=7398 RepID=A0A1A9ZNS2_GLOPL